MIKTNNNKKNGSKDWVLRWKTWPTVRDYAKPLPGDSVAARPVVVAAIRADVAAAPGDVAVVV